MINIKRLGFTIVFFACFFSSDAYFAQKINQFDANNKRTGIWKKYHNNDNIRYEGAFENGKEIGVFKFYEASNPSNPAIVKTYSKLTDSVAVSFFTLQGKLQTKGFFIDKNRVGKWTYFFADGKKMSEEFYTSGKLEGTLTNFYPNGKATEITNYKNGMKHGISQKFSSDGILLEEVTFKNNILNGLAKYFELNGSLKERGIYENGKRIGKWEFFIDGEVAPDDLKNEKATFINKN